MIASIIAFHSDERGLMLPPNIAPYQVVIIPIPHPDTDIFKMVNEYCDKVSNTLIQAGMRVYIDRREDMKPVDKFFEWELKGAPVRIEIGCREIQNNAVTIFRRDTMKRRVVRVEELVQELRKDFDEIRHNVMLRAWEWFKSNIKIAYKFSDALEMIKSKGGIALLPWCGNENCVRTLIESEEGVEALGEVYQSTLDRLDIKGVVSAETTCGFCNGKAAAVIAIAKRH